MSLFWNLLTKTWGKHTLHDAFDIGNEKAPVDCIYRGFFLYEPKREVEQVRV